MKIAIKQKSATVNHANATAQNPKKQATAQGYGLQPHKAESITRSPLVAQQQKKIGHLFGNAKQCKIDPKKKEKTLQPQWALPKAMRNGEKLPSQAKAITQRVKNKTGLPDNLKTGVEQLAGLNMNDVQVHYNSTKPAGVQAYAYTQGTNIHVAPGQERHLAHEAWHVAQQKQGRVQPTTTVGGIPVNDNPGLEHEADVMGAKATKL